MHETWMFEVRCPSCGHQHQKWSREGAERPSEIECHCDARFSIAYLTREGLYETVWTDPVSRLAEKYAISGVGLKKLCRRVDVPVPPVGYWQQKAFGRTPERPSLPPAPAACREPIALPLRSPDLESPRPADVAALIGQEESAERRIQVAEQLRNPHPLVHRAGVVLKAAKADDSAIVRAPWAERCLDIAVAKENVPRCLRIVNALARAVETRGWSLKVGEGRDQGTHVGVLGQSVQFEIVERTLRSERALTKKDEEDVRKYGRTWGPKWDFRPSGSLELRLNETAGHGLRRAWKDAEGKPLEDQLDAVLVGIILVADAKRTAQAAAERRQREWQEAERTRLEAEARRREEAERLARIEAEAVAWSKSQRWRAYADAVERDAIDRDVSIKEGGEMYRWLAWARTHADRLDPIKSRRPLAGEREEQP